MSYEYDVNQLDYWQQERLREKLTAQVTEENFREYEEGILNFFNDDYTEFFCLFLEDKFFLMEIFLQLYQNLMKIYNL